MKCARASWSEGEGEGVCAQVAQELARRAVFLAARNVPAAGQAAPDGGSPRCQTSTACPSNLHARPKAPAMQPCSHRCSRRSHSLPALPRGDPAEVLRAGAAISRGTPASRRLLFLSPRLFLPLCQSRPRAFGLQATESALADRQALPPPVAPLPRRHSPLRDDRSFGQCRFESAPRLPL